MKRFIFKVMLIISPFIIALVIELFILPVDFFTFRVWESVLVKKFTFPGYFYPNMHIKKYEKGDNNGFRSKKVKLVEWYTDEYGFRNKINNKKINYDIITIGDSNIVGSYLDQSNTLAEVLAKKSGLNVYNYGGPGINTYLEDKRFKDNPPKYVILEARTGEFFVKNSKRFYPEIIKKDNNGVYYIKTLKNKYAFIPKKLRIILDRILKQNMFNFIKSRIGAALWKVSDKNELSLEEGREFAYNSIFTIRKELRSRGSELLFYFMPHGDRRLDPVIIRLKNENVKILAYLPNEKYPHGIDLDWFYHKEDTHWTEETVEFTAEELIKIILREE